MLIGIDIGTSGTKAILMREDGIIVKSHHEEYGIDTPQPGWAEQNPELWVEKAFVCLSQVRPDSGETVHGIAFSGQMHGIVMVDGAGTPLRPAIIWADSRSHDALEEISQRFPMETFCRTILNRPAAGFGIASLVWLKNHEPQILDKASAVLCVKDYVRYRLTGEIGQEASDASGTCCLDVQKRQWAWDILNGLGLPDRIFPAVASSIDQAGSLSKEAAARCGLAAGTPVYYGGADNGVAGIGSGVIAEGDMYVNIGTGGQCGTIAAQPYFDKEYRTSTFCHSVPDRWNLFGASLCAGLSMKWFRDVFFPGKSFADLSSLAAQAQPGSGGVMYLPYLTGERTPWLDPRARGLFFGLSLEHGQAEIARSVMEGVTYALRQSFDILVKAGVKPTSMLSTGGGAKSAVWPQIQADMFGLPVKAAQGGDACTGAAILAGVGSGIYKDVFEGVAAAVKLEGTVFEPNAKAHELYLANIDKFAQLYIRNRELFYL